MRIFAIKDDSLSPDTVLGYLIYYERAKTYYIELPDGSDPWETPLLLSGFAKRGQYSVGSYWSRLWVQQRIVPPDRQNIGMVLKENGLTEYDEFKLLMLAMGRCAQDDCRLEEIDRDKIPELLISRWKTKIEDIVPLQDSRLLIFFRNGEARITDTGRLAETHIECKPYLANPERFAAVEVQPDGYGVMWSERAALPHRELYDEGTEVPLSLNDFILFVQHRIVSTGEACRILNCSRQNIDDLIKRNRIHTVRRDIKYKLFLKSEIVQHRKV